MSPLILAAFAEDFLTYSIAIVAIGFLIFVHELGHFLACRATKTRVETFSIGFGPRLFGWEREKGGLSWRFTVGRRRLSPTDHAMDVRIAAVPLGGYVKMAGEIGGDASPGDPRGRAVELHATDEFPAKPFLSRLLIITAGVLMNALTAWVFLSVAYALGVPEPEPVLGRVEPGEPAWDAGVEVGDRILSIDGTPVASFMDVRLETPLLRTGRVVTLEVEREGVRRELSVRPESSAEEGIPRLGIGESYSWTHGEGPDLFTVGPAERAVVAGRAVVGGFETQVAVRDAMTLGISPIRVEKPDGSARDVDATPKGTEPTTKRLGLVLQPSFVVEAVRRGSPAERAGLQPGDRVVGADGKPLDRRARLGFVSSIGTLEVRRDGETRTLEVGAADPEAVAAFLRGIAFREPKEVYVDVDERFPGGSPAAAAGLRPGDLLLEVDGEPVSSFQDVAERTQAADGRAMRLRVRTGDEPVRDVTVTPREAPSVAPAGMLVRSEKTIGGTGIGDALALGTKRTGREFVNLFRMLRSFFTGDIKFEKGVGGPGTLIHYSSQSYQAGFPLFLLFLAVISVNLAVLNILPIPVLDGGQLLFLVIEKVRGRPLKEATVAKAQLVGLFLLLALMVFALRNDFKLLSR